MNIHSKVCMLQVRTYYRVFFPLMMTLLFHANHCKVCKTFGLRTAGSLVIDVSSLLPACIKLYFMPRVLVGVSPRMHAFDVDTGEIRYLRWQHVWWNGFYSIMLTKASMLHRNYFDSYKNLMSKFALDYIDKHKNCEDLAMAFVVATEVLVLNTNFPHQ